MQSLGEKKETLLLNKYIDLICEYYGKSIIKIILFGSYAREEQGASSDIDIMVILDCDDTELIARQKPLLHLTCDFNMENFSDIQDVPISVDNFKKWRSVNNFYKNIDREGIVLYDSSKEAA